jgi:hypothetical protein
MQNQKNFSPVDDRSWESASYLDKSSGWANERLVPASGSVVDESGIRRSGTIRTGLVERIRRQIREGDYLTEQRIDITVARLIDDLRTYAPASADVMDSRLA